MAAGLQQPTEHKVVQTSVDIIGKIHQNILDCRKIAAVFP
jgi:hypothetical protein